MLLHGAIGLRWAKTSVPFKLVVGLAGSTVLSLLVRCVGSSSLFVLFNREYLMVSPSEAVGSSQISRRGLMAAGVSALALAALPKLSGAEQAAPARASMSPERLAYRTMFAHVGLTMVSESGPGFGSGVIIEPINGLAKLLNPNEVLVLSVSHNASDWTAQARAYGTVFSPSVADPRQWSRDAAYDARLLGRFINTGDGLAIDRKSVSTVDIAFFALKVPADHLKNIRGRALPVTSESLTSLRPGTPVVAVGSRGSERKPDGTFQSSTPTWRNGIVLDPNTESQSERVKTQYGAIARQMISTTIQCEPGDSGGALVWFNPTQNRLEVLGACTGGSNIGSGPGAWLDFRLDRAGVSQELIDAHGMERAAQMVIPEARTPYRGLFTGWQAAQDLAEAVESQYEGLLAERSDLQRRYKSLERALSEGDPDGKLVDSLKVLHDRASAAISEKINQLKPKE